MRIKLTIRLVLCLFFAPVVTHGVLAQDLAAPEPAPSFEAKSQQYYAELNRKRLAEPQPGDMLLDLTATTGSDSLQGVTGIFKAQGKGMLIELKADNTITSFEITRLSCVPGDMADVPIVDVLQKVNVSFSDGAHDAFTLRQKGTVTVHHFVREAALPVQCMNSGEANRDPLYNFDIFWQTFADHYPVFELRGVDWMHQREVYRPQLASTSTDLELFTILSEMVRPLEDVHVQVNSPFGRFNPGATPEKRIIVATRINHPQTNAIISSYLDEGGFQYNWDNNLRIGSIADNILYVQLNSFSPRNPDQLGNNELHQAFLSVIDTALMDHPDLEGVIIDIRKNGGGFDSLGVLLAGRFTDSIRPAFAEQMLGPEGRAPLVSFNIVPAGPRQFTGPVVLLTSPATTSGAENFAIDMLGLPNVTIMGEATAGSVSTRQERSLPNGFTFSLPFEYEMAPDGRIFEMDGVQPDIALVNFSAMDIAGKKDSVLEKAISVIRQ